MAIENWVRKAGTTYEYSNTGNPILLGVIPLVEVYKTDPTLAYDDNPNWSSVYGGGRQSNSTSFQANFTSPITLSRLGASFTVWLAGGGPTGGYTIEYFNGTWHYQVNSNTGIGNYTPPNLTLTSLDYTDLNIPNVTKVKATAFHTTEIICVSVIGELWAYGEGGKGPFPVHFNEAGLPT